jgi:hypothetical protein
MFIVIQIGGKSRELFAICEVHLIAFVGNE